MVIGVAGGLGPRGDTDLAVDVRQMPGDRPVADEQRGTDLAVRLLYAGIDHQLIHDPVDAIRACPPGRVEVLANYTAFRDLKKALTKQEDYRG